MAKEAIEWLKQADYDMDTADTMYGTGRYFYAVFMCHLSIEKALKGLYLDRLKEVPPRVHNLVYLLNKAGIRPPENLGRFIVKLNEASVATRYPEELATLMKNYTESVVRDILAQGKEVLKWIKTQF